jgi:hypothetical protein
MSTNIRMLPNGALPSAERSEAVVSVLREALACAESGHLAGIAIGAVDSQGDLLTWKAWSPPASGLAVLGAAHMAANEVGAAVDLNTTRD